MYPMEPEVGQQASVTCFGGLWLSVLLYALAKFLEQVPEDSKVLLVASFPAR